MSSNLYEASHQWSTRPDDERFDSLKAMYDATKAYADSATEALAPLSSLRVEVDSGDLKLVGKANVPARLTHYSFGQLARVAKAPAEYLRKLPATLAMQNLNHGLKEITKDRVAADDKMQLLFHKNGSLVTRAITSDRYDRIWNYEVVAKIINNLAGDGWVVPPARPVREGQRGTRVATAADILPNQADFGLSVKEGDLIAPAGLYASDHDMFAFLCKMDGGVFDGQKVLNKGVFVQNSEVGDCALKFKFFLVDQICGNHICWNVSDVVDASVRHMKGRGVERGNTLGNAMAKWQVMVRGLPSDGTLENGIKKAREFEIAATKDEVLDAVFAFGKKKNLDKLGRKALDAAYDIAASSPRYGNPNTVWAMMNGLTEYSQKTSYTDDRTDMDVQAGRVLEMAF